MKILIHAQRGVALITALLVVTIAASAAVAISADLQREIRRTGNMLNHEQAFAYTQAVEDFARYGLKLDFDAGKTDDLNELWHTTPVAEEIAGGTLTGKLDDLQGRFNLNNLAGKHSLDIDRFKRLLGALNFTPDEQQNLTATLVDWLDDDQTTYNPYGAEDGYYLGLAEPMRPYLAANRMFSSLSELALVKGFDSDVMLRLRLTETTDPLTGETLPPLFTALPETTAININTAPAEVLISLDANMTMALAQQVIEQRDGAIKSGGSATPFADVADFKKYCDSIGIKNLDTDKLAVSTDYFLVKTNITIDRAQMNMTSILNRNANGLSRVISHSQGVY